MIPERRKPERRRVFVIDEAKFDTQKAVTYILLLIFAVVTVRIMLGDDQAERSTILQTVINFTMLAVGYWLGSSKGADKPSSISTITASSTRSDDKGEQK